MIELSGHVYISLSEEDIAEAGGDFGQAVQNAIGHTGATVSDVMDDEDNRTLEQRKTP